MSHKTQSANVVSKSETKGAAKQQVTATANTTRRVVETRDMYEVIYNHSVNLVVLYARGLKATDDPRKGFAFGPTAEQPHTRGYAKSLIWGFATNKAGKVLKNFEDLDTVAKREKIALAILSDCKLVKGDSEALKASLNKVEPKRERAFAESVLAELTKPQPKKRTTPKGGKDTKSETKATAPKGSKAEGETKKVSTPKGGKKSETKKAAPKGAKANGKKASK